MLPKLRFTAPVRLAAAADGKPRRLTILGYTGGPMSVTNHGTIVIDLAGMELTETVPVLADHENRLAAVIGTGRPNTDGKELRVDATLAETAAAETVLQQFHDVYMEYLPQYLDLLAEMYGLDTKEWAGKHETKEGRKLSTATKDSLSKCHGHMKSAFDLLDALLGDEAGEDVEDDSEDATSKAAAAIQPKSEPEFDHSAAESLKELRALLRA